MFVQLLFTADALLASNAPVPTPTPISMTSKRFLAPRSLAEANASAMNVPGYMEHCPDLSVEPCRSMIRSIHDPNFDSARTASETIIEGEGGPFGSGIPHTTPPPSSAADGNYILTDAPEGNSFETIGCKPFLNMDPYWGDSSKFPERSVRTWLTTRCCTNEVGCLPNAHCDPCAPRGAILYGPEHDRRWCLPGGLEENLEDAKYLLCAQPTRLEDQLVCEEDINGRGMRWKFPAAPAALMCNIAQGELDKVIRNVTTRADALEYTRPPTPVPTTYIGEYT